MRYLPAYSPDLNPIEQAFAKLKAALRKAAARTFDTLVEAIADALDTFTPEHPRRMQKLQSQIQAIAANRENALD